MGMSGSWTLHWVTALLICRAVAQYSSDLCNWRGSGLSHEPHLRDVEQVYLRCAQGSLEWLYPTGAIIINLRPNSEPLSRHTTGLHACIKPHTDSKGSQIYLERAGELKLLLTEEQQSQGEVHCFSLTEGALFVEAAAHSDISRRITTFQYELVSTCPGVHIFPYLHQGPVTCKPCSDEEVLKAVCTSDFVAVGVFHSTAPGPGAHTVAVVALSQLLRQKSSLFVWAGGRGRRWTGRVNVPTQCPLPPQRNQYILTGSVHFGEAWLGCAPRYRDFMDLYERAHEEGTNPCEINVY
ncbi:meteorin-like protein isoform X6 [Boleophthalmus pectinirostris]|uniref:meteorin-like protein isoform X6 n=1 Tax=Boleophthalmus pectinirostris TaxID=150288 RepID=UPI00242E0CF5|nr:meteorin-like protein isoform X6 [Boleophthalmus pectinirostris]